MLRFCGFTVLIAVVSPACYALTTVDHKPLRVGSDDTGCTLHFTVEWHTSDEPMEEVNPQLLTFRVDCQNASASVQKFREFEIWDEHHVCTHLTAFEYSKDYFQGGKDVGKFILRNEDLVEFRCILLPLNFSAPCDAFKPTMKIMFLNTREEDEFVITDWVVPDLKDGPWGRNNLADANDWLLDIQKSKGTEETVRFQSPELENTSPFPSLPQNGHKLYTVVSKVDEDFLNPTIVSVACKTLPGIDLTDSVHMVKSFFSIEDYGDTPESIWFGIRFDLDVNTSMIYSFPPGRHDLKLLMHFSFHRESRGLLDSDHEQTLVVPVNVAGPDSPDHPDHPNNPNNPHTKQRSRFWFRMVIFFIVLLMVSVVTYHCCRRKPAEHAEQTRPARSRTESNIELRTSA